MITGKTVCTSVQRRYSAHLFFNLRYTARYLVTPAVALEMTFAGMYRIKQQKYSESHCTQDLYIVSKVVKRQYFFSKVREPGLSAVTEIAMLSWFQNIGRFKRIELSRI